MQGVMPLGIAIALLVVMILPHESFSFLVYQTRISHHPIAEG
jgi:hypothetical protein